MQVPREWSLEVERDDDWEPFPLYNTDSYGVAADQYNVIHPAQPVTVDRLRLQISPQADAAAGILELVVNPED